MKKTLIALAALASTAAFAQSSVTLFGRVDASIGSIKTTTGGVTSKATTSLFNGGAGGLTGSRWGMQGTEDLGGGLKAVFKLENRFNIDDSTDTSGFSGDAFVGLSGGFGTVHLGRTYTAYDSAKAVSVGSSVFDSAFTPNGFPSYTVRGSNQIKYVSPSFGGVSAIVSSALKETNTAGVKDVNSLALMYGAGPISAALGYQVESNNDKVTVLSGAYNFGVASVSAGYSTLSGNGTNNDQNGLNIGVDVPMGAFNFSVGLGKGKTETSAGAKVSDYTGYGVGMTYSLSKRTRLYAGLKDEKTENAAGVKQTGTRLYAAGVRHDF